MFTLVEACCGSAALTLHTLGATKPLLPYQGSKWRFRRELSALLTEVGAEGIPRRIELYDVAAWGIVAGCVIRPSTRAGIIDRLEFLSRLDPKVVYDALHLQSVPEDEVEFSAQFLFLQRLSYSGKAVGVRDGRWLSPGFNSSSAYGLPGTERFGEVQPMIPSLLRTLRGYTTLTAPERLSSRSSSAPQPSGRCSESTVVYIDPPYSGSTLYPDGDLDRKNVVSLALQWYEAGARVIVSEAHAIMELGRLGWGARRLFEGRMDTSPFRGKQEEWVTLSPHWRSS